MQRIDYNSSFDGTSTLRVASGVAEHQILQGIYHFNVNWSIVSLVIFLAHFQFPQWWHAMMSLIEFFCVCFYCRACDES
jgi:hypothetical protein